MLSPQEIVFAAMQPRTCLLAHARSAQFGQDVLHVFVASSKHVIWRHLVAIWHLCITERVFFVVSLELMCGLSFVVLTFIYYALIKCRATSITKRKHVAFLLA